MKNVIILHGSTDEEEFFDEHYPTGSNSHWLPWLQKKLINNGIETQTPEMTNQYNPNYNDWKHVFDQFTVTPETIFVGFSSGAGFMLRWLSDTSTKINKLIMVAPWLDPKEDYEDFVNKPIDPKIATQVDEIYTLHSDSDDEPGSKDSLEEIKQVLPNTKLIEFSNYGHFTLNDMKTEKFPELLDLILS